VTIPPISGVPASVPAAAPASGPAAPAGKGFGEAISDMLKDVSHAEFNADALATDVALGGETSVHELMVAMTKASLSVDLLVQVRNRALEAYQEVMRMQI
jgi:flagellar hook-basal body complex protein FliE